MARKGRELEILIAQIENEINRLSGNSVVVKSPDNILNKLTGTTQEVDVSIRYKIGSVSILIIIECRDRKNNEDIMWIQQLNSKKENLGANALIAVSSSGFSQPAITLAKQYGIDIRTFKEVESGSEWLKDLKISNQFKLWSFSKLDLILEGSEKNLQISDNIKNNIQNYQDRMVLSTDKKTGQKIILRDLGELFLERGSFPKIAGITGIGEIAFPYNSQFFIHTDSGDKRLLGIKMNVRIDKVVNLTESLIKMFEYRSEGDLLLKMINVEYKDYKINIISGNSK